MNNELVRVTSASLISNELAVVPFTSGSAINDGFVHATSAGVRARGSRGLQMSPALSGIWDEAAQLYHVQGRLRSVLAAADGKEIQNEQLVRYLREARHQESQSEDLLSELVYYRIQEELEPGEGSRMDESPGQRHAPQDLQPQVQLFEEEEDSGIGIVDMEQMEHSLPSTRGCMPCCSLFFHGTTTSLCPIDQEISIMSSMKKACCICILRL